MMFFFLSFLMTPLVEPVLVESINKHVYGRIGHLITKNLYWLAARHVSSIHRYLADITCIDLPQFLVQNCQ